MQNDDKVKEENVYPTVVDIQRAQKPKSPKGKSKNCVQYLRVLINQRFK